MNRNDKEQGHGPVADISHLEFFTKKVAKAVTVTGEKIIVKNRSQNLWRDNNGQLHSLAKGLTAHWTKIQ